MSPDDANPRANGTAARLDLHDQPNLIVVLGWGVTEVAFNEVADLECIFHPLYSTTPEGALHEKVHKKRDPPPGRAVKIGGHGRWGGGQRF